MSSNDLEPISGELVQTHGRTLFQTDDPVEVLDHARRMSDALKTALDEGGMTMRIGGNEHVLIDGWTTLGAMLGVSPNVIWSRPLPDGQGWEARAEARTVDGRVVGTAEAMVTRDERNWKRADEYAVRSMAQTRACSKALRGPLGFVITLAGRNATPAEEVVEEPTGDARVPVWAQDIDGDQLDRFGDRLTEIVKATGVEIAPEQVAIAIANAVTGYAANTVPAVCALLVARLHEATTTGGPAVPATDDTPAAAAPDVPPTEEP